MTDTNSPADEQPPVRPLRGLVALLALPLIVLLDQFVSQASGFPLRSLGTFALVPWASAVCVVIGSAAYLTRRGRAWLDAQRRFFALGTCGLIAGIAAAEGTIERLRPASEFHLRDAGAFFDFTPDPHLIFGVDSQTHSTYNRQGVRGPDWTSPREALRVLCVGGSTTECYYVDDQDAWTAVLARELAVATGSRCWVGAAAVSEMATGHHARFLNTSPLLDDVDTVVVMPGANDLVRLLLGLDQGNTRVPTWYELQFVQLSKDYWNITRRNGFWADAAGNRLVGVLRLGRAIPERAIDWDAAEAEYAERLAEICKAATRRKTKLVLVSQPFLWKENLSPIGVKRLLWARVAPFRRPWDLLNAKAMGAVADRFNARVIEVGRQHSCQVIDAAAELNGKEPYFYDDFHLNNAGCEALGKLIASALNKEPGGRSSRSE